MFAIAGSNPNQEDHVEDQCVTADSYSSIDHIRFLNNFFRK